MSDPEMPRGVVHRPFSLDEGLDETHHDSSHFVSEIFEVFDSIFKESWPTLFSGLP